MTTSSKPQVNHEASSELINAAFYGNNRQTMERIGRKEIDIIRNEMQSHLDQVGEQLGISLTLGKGMYSNESHGTFKLEIATISNDGIVNTRESEDYLDVCKWDDDLDPGWLNEMFDINGNDYILRGWINKGRKFQITGEQVGAGGTGNGKMYKFTRDSLVRSMKLAAICS